jgi:hypothetical protein
MLCARLEWASPETTGASLGATNLTDQEYFLNKFDLTAFDSRRSKVAGRTARRRAVHAQLQLKAKRNREKEARSAFERAFSFQVEFGMEQLKTRWPSNRRCQRYQAWHTAIVAAGMLASRRCAPGSPSRMPAPGSSSQQQSRRVKCINSA